ncbi:phosphotransferase [Actinoplanes sp. NPDC051861]|uniref:phosphotransferase n=1 Tax=Actinoplanes sp. NPDC051861 TaxID=3155170 RepID=UPI003446007A
MKTLPDNPDINHLRRQAKDLLAGLRETHPDATLAEAQTCLAEQYGFGGWADLKAEVDRQQGNAAVAAPALARQIADRFGLGRVDGEMRSMARPDEMGRRWLLITDRGRWTARTVDDVYPVTDGEENARFQEAAARAGVTLPAPVRSRAGRVTELIEGSSWRVYEWVRSGPPLVAPVDAAVTREAGRILAVLHSLSYPSERLCPWSSTVLSGRTWPEAAELAAEKGAPWAPELAAAVPTLLELREVAEAPAAEPVMCHNNFNPGNVRVAGGRLVVSGWEHAAGLPPAWELCAALVSWAGGNPRALAEGYGPLPPLSIESFRGTATALQNYVAGQIETGDDRSIRHLLTHLPSRRTYEDLLAAIGQ